MDLTAFSAQLASGRWQNSRSRGPVNENRTRIHGIGVDQPRTLQPRGNFFPGQPLSDCRNDPQVFNIPHPNLPILAVATPGPLLP